MDTHGSDESPGSYARWGGKKEQSQTTDFAVLFIEHS